MAKDAGTSTWRAIAFRGGQVSAAFSMAACICSWINPFPLLSGPEGGLHINPLDDWVLGIGLLTGVLAVILAGFGKGVGRVLTAFSGLLLFLINYFVWLGNHR